MSPYCPGVTLHDCPSQNALELRDDIENYARDGMTEAEIMDRLEADFGPTIRAEPSSEGAGILAWILPSIALLIGGGLAWMLVRRWFKRSRGIEDGDGRQVVTVSGDERERLDAELRRLRRES
jgi:cytochrome c-type biogenesis protein CcmH/NrfF